MKPIIIILPIILAAACRTPQPVMDQATLGAAMEHELSLTYATYKEAMDGMVADREKLIGARQRAAAEELNALAPTKFAASALSGTSGQTADEKTAKKLSDMADVIAVQEATSIAIVSKSTQHPSLTPLPFLSDKTLAAQKAFAQMGEEQSFTSRVKEYRGFYDTVKKGVDDNKKKIEEAAVKAKNQSKQ